MKCGIRRTRQPRRCLTCFGLLRSLQYRTGEGEALLETLNSLKDKIQGMRNAQQRAKRAVDAFVNQEEDTVVEKLPKRCDQYAAYLLRTDHDYSKAGIARALGLRSPQEAKELLEKAKRSFEECAAYSAERKEIAKNYEKARKKVGDALGLQVVFCRMGPCMSRPFLRGFPECSVTDDAASPAASRDYSTALWFLPFRPDVPTQRRFSLIQWVTPSSTQPP